MTPTDPNERMQEIRQSVADYRSGLDANGDALPPGDLPHHPNYKRVEVEEPAESAAIDAPNPGPYWEQEDGPPQVTERLRDLLQTDTLPSDSQARKGLPIATGVIDYFPAALAEVAKVSKFGNDKHNPGEPLHHARGKSMDHADCAIRHFIDRGKIDPDTGMRHSALAAWRLLALLQEELEAEGLAPLPRGARL